MYETHTLDDGTEIVTILQSHYDELDKDATMLRCLRNQGVDNWDGWDYAVEEYNLFVDGGE